MSIIYHIAKNTLRECLRQPIYIILMITTLVIIGCYPIFSWFVFREQEKLVIDGSLASILLFGLITAVLCSSHAVFREIESGTVLLILSKPVSRSQFILAKVVGIGAALTIFVVVTGLAAVMMLRAATDQFRFDHNVIIAYFVLMGLANIYGGARNYFTSRSYAAECTKGLTVLMIILATIVFFLPEWSSSRYNWKEGSAMYNPELAMELVLILFAVWAMGAMAVAFSTRLNLVSNMTVCMSIFFLGLMSNYIYHNLKDLERTRIEEMLFSWHLL